MRHDFGQFNVFVGAGYHASAEFRRKFPVSKICSALTLTNLEGFGGGGKLTVAFAVLTSGTTWTVDGTFNKADNKVEAIGGGAGGGKGGSGTTTLGGTGANGGGGGAYCFITNFDPAGATTITIQIGAGGAIASSGGGNAGTDTFFSSTGTLLAKAGTVPTGGVAASCVPSGNARSGGTGAGGTANSGGTGGVGGGGAGGAGSTSAGGNGSGQTKGTKGTGLLADGATAPGDGGDGRNGGAGGNAGSPGATGSTYGGAGGGGGGGGRKLAVCDPPGFPGGNGAAGAQGVIVIWWRFFA